MKAIIKAIACVTAVIAMLLLSDVGVVVASRSVIFLIVQIFVGVSIYRLLRPSSESTPPNMFAQIGIGFILGAITFVSIDQIVIKFDLAEQVFYFLIFAFLIPGAISSYLDASKKRLSEKFEKSLPQMILLMTVFSLSLLLSSWYWLIPAWPFMAVGSALICFKSQSFKPLDVIGLIFLSSGVLLLIDQARKRPEFWSVHHLHYQFDEALNISFSKFGIFENMMAVGEPLNYHWFSHAWIGMLSKIVGADDWIISTRVMPLVIAFMISGLAFAIGSKATANAVGGYVVAGLFVVSPVFHVISPEISWVMTTSHSQFFGVLFVLAFVYVLVDSELSSSFKTTFILSVLLATTTLTKVNHAVILVAGFTVLVIFEIAARNARRIQLFGHYLIVVLPASFAFAISQGVGSSSGARVGFIPLAAQMSGDFKNMVGLRRELIAIYFLIGVFGLAIFVSVVSLTRTDGLFSRMTIFALGTTATGIGIATIFDFGVDGRQVYFWNSALTIVWLMSGVLFYGAFTARRHLYSQKTSALIIAASFVVFLFVSAVPNLNSGSDLAALLRSTSSNATVVFPLLLLAILLFVLFTKKEVTYFNGQFIRDHLILSVVATSMVFFVATHIERFNNDYRSVESESAEIVVPADLQAIGAWFAENTRVDTVVASNSFCVSDNCTEKNLNTFSTTGDPEYRLSGSSTDYRMAIAIKRRFLITSFTFLSTDGVLQEWAVARVRLSRDFGSVPTRDLLERLREFDVRYFINDAEVHDRLNWYPFGTVVYQVGRYKIIDLGSGF